MPQEKGSALGEIPPITLVCGQCNIQLIVIETIGQKNECKGESKLADARDRLVRAKNNRRVIFINPCSNDGSPINHLLTQHFLKGATGAALHKKRSSGS